MAVTGSAITTAELRSSAVSRLAGGAIGAGIGDGLARFVVHRGCRPSARGQVTCGPSSDDGCGSVVTRRCSSSTWPGGAVVVLGRGPAPRSRPDARGPMALESAAGAASSSRTPAYFVRRRSCCCCSCGQKCVIRRSSRAMTWQDAIIAVRRGWTGGRRGQQGGRLGATRLRGRADPARRVSGAPRSSRAGDGGRRRPRRPASSSTPVQIDADRKAAMAQLRRVSALATTLAGPADRRESLGDDVQREPRRRPVPLRLEGARRGLRGPPPTPGAGGRRPAGGLRAGRTRAGRPVG